MNKVSVISTAHFDNYELVKDELEKENIDVLVLGGRRGADRYAQQYALEKDLVTQVFLPDYRTFGKTANYQRNLLIIDNSTKVLIFWDGYTRGIFKYIEYLKASKTNFRTIMY